MKNKQFVISLLILLFIFGLFAFFRFYNLDKRIIFDWDQEQFSYQIKGIIKDHHFTLLGPRTTNDKGFFLGPYFTYLLVPFYLITNLHPAALIYLIVFYNLGFFLLLYFVLTKLFSKFHALVFLLFWGLSPLLIRYDTIPWWPLLIPFGVILIWYSLFRLSKVPDLKNFILLGLVLGLFINMHFQFIFLVVFAIAFLIFSQRQKKIINFKKLLSFVSSFLIVFLPLLFFDLRHNFLNTNLFLKFFTTPSDNQPYDPNVWQTVFINFLSPLTLIYSRLTLLFFYLIIVSSLLYLLKKRDGFYRNFYLASLVVWFFVPLFFTFYAKRPSEYYFLFLAPFIITIITDLASEFLKEKKYLLLVLIGVVAFKNIATIKETLQINPLGLYYKDKAVYNIKKLTRNTSFNITFDTPLGLNSGFNYLIDYYQIKRSNNPKDPLVEIVNPPKGKGIKINDAIMLKIPTELRR